MRRVESVLPEELRQRTERSRVFAPQTPSRQALREQLDALHAAVDARPVVGIEYRREDGGSSRRDVEPLCLAFWGHVWTLGSWCRLRKDFRSFRLDRIALIESRDEVVPEDTSRNLAAYLAAMGAGPDPEP